jgi:hypothetical protein
MSQRFNIRPATHNDSEALITLINSTPQPGSIRLNFERTPDFFHATETTTSEPDVWLMEDTQEQRLVASFSIGKRFVYINGKKQLTRYGNDLRIHEDYKGGRTLFRLFKKYRELMQDHPAGKLLTHMIALNQNIRRITCVQSEHRIRRASENDIDILQTFFDKYSSEKQFYPCYDFSKIDSNDQYYRNLNLSNYYLCFNKQELVAVTGVWDQKSFKQTRFLSYHGNMKVLRHINNISSKILGGLNLPSPGSLGNYISLHSILCKDNEPAFLKSLITEIMTEHKKTQYDALILGLDEQDQLHDAVKNLKRHSLVSNHYLASYGDQPDVLNHPSAPPLIYLEPSRL